MYTPRGEASDAFYQELLGIAIGALLARTNEVTAYSDCQAAIRRSRQAVNPLGAAVGQLQYGQLLLAIRAIRARQRHTITWVKAHPERSKPRDAWDIHDHGIHMADLIAGCAVDKSAENSDIIFHQCNADEFLRATTPHGTWTWCQNHVPIKESFKQIAQRHHFQVYRNTRDHIRVQQNTPARWNQYCAPLMATLNKAKMPLLARNRGRLVKHVYDWMAHSTNLAKSSTVIDHAHAARCLLCDGQETQAHVNTTCPHPTLMDIRQLHRRKIEEHLLCLQHQSLPKSQRWVRLLVDFAEDHMWEDTELAGDIWNGRWRRQDIDTILGRYASEVIPLEDLHQGLQWLTELTLRLQRAQQILYTARGSLLHTKAKEMALVEKRRATGGPKTQTLYKVWKILYTRKPRRPRVFSERPPCLGPPGIHTFEQIITHQKRWMKHPPPTPQADRKKGILRNRRKARASSARQVTRRALGREDHRSQKLKLCRRRRRRV